MISKPHVLDAFCRSDNITGLKIRTTHSIEIPGVWISPILSFNEHGRFIQPHSKSFLSSGTFVQFLHQLHQISIDYDLLSMQYGIISSKNSEILF